MPKWRHIRSVSYGMCFLGSSGRHDSVPRMRPTFFALFLVAALSGCTKVNPDAPDAAGTGFDADVTYDANLQACTPDTSVCADDVETICNASGAVARQTTCTLGCFDDERCGKLDPSNGLAGHLDDAAETTDLLLGASATIDTTNGSVADETGAIAVTTAFDDSNAVGVLVIKVKSLTATNITVVGTRALAIVSDGDVRINGLVTLSAVSNQDGAGAHLSDTTCRGKAGAVAAGGSGGGGAGFGGSGGAGGGATGAAGGEGGGVSGNAALVPLRGGCRGGYGGGNSVPAQATQIDVGGGGGAIQIVSNTSIRVESSAGIAANGGGGKGDTSGTIFFCLASIICRAGDGGGSGGGILLEAPEVHLAPGSVLVANGGGGRCGDIEFGEDGRLNASQALGASCPSANGSDGGAGGAGATIGGVSAVNNLGDGEEAAGGGGGAGRIRVGLPLGETFAPDGLVSPAATAGVLDVR